MSTTMVWVAKAILKDNVHEFRGVYTSIESFCKDMKLLFENVQTIELSYNTYTHMYIAKLANMTYVLEQKEVF